MKQEPISITGMWFRANASGTIMTVLIEVDGQWREVATFAGKGDGPTSYIVEPLGLRVAIQEGRPNEIH